MEAKQVEIIFGKPFAKTLRKSLADRLWPEIQYRMLKKRYNCEGNVATHIGLRIYLTRALMAADYRLRRVV